MNQIDALIHPETLGEYVTTKTLCLLKLACIKSGGTIAGSGYTGEPTAKREICAEWRTARLDLQRDDPLRVFGDECAKRWASDLLEQNSQLQAVNLEGKSYANGRGRFSIVAELTEITEITR